MSSSVHVPHRLRLPTTQVGHPYDISPASNSDKTERAFDLAYSEYQSYVGSPALQSQILAEALDDITFVDEVDQAARRIADTALVTPLYEYEGFVVKDETVQPTKAYKIRGATNFILKHHLRAKEAGVVTASAGNHGQAVALAAAKIGVEAIIVVPHGTPAIKRAGIVAYGGRVLVYGADYNEASKKAEEINHRQQGLYVPAYNHRDIMAGQATLAREILAQVPNVLNVVVPTGGGGILAGIARYLAVEAPQVKVYGAGVAGGSALETAYTSGNRGWTKANKFADGIAVARLGDKTWTEIKRHAEGVLIVKEAELRATIGRLSFYDHTVEAAGAVGLAAAMTNRDRLAGLTVVVATGGNIDPGVLAECRQRVGLSAQYQLTNRREFSTI